MALSQSGFPVKLAERAAVRSPADCSIDGRPHDVPLQTPAKNIGIRAEGALPPTRLPLPSRMAPSTASPSEALQASSH